MVQQAAHKPWIVRQLWWLIPSAILLFLSLIVGFIFAIYSLASSMIKGSEPYQYSLELARESNEVAEYLGDSFEVGYWMSGSISTNGARGEADMAIPLKGEKGDGTLYVLAEKRAEQWYYDTLTVAIENGPAIDLE